MFIAIVVDTYLIRKEANSRCVKDLEIENFQEIWKEFDNYATGMITIAQLDPFIEKLSSTGHGFFPYNVELMKDAKIRKYFISFL